MTPAEILSTYGADVTGLSPEYSTYRIATNQDLWLCTTSSERPNTDPTGVIDVRVGDLIIETPDDYRSSIYKYKIPSRHMNLTGPDFFYYIYHPSLKTGTLRDCILFYLNDWVNRNVQGTMTIRLFSNKKSFMVYADSLQTVVEKEEGSDYIMSSLDKVFSKWGNCFIVENLYQVLNGCTNCDFVGDLPKQA
jgi:hypothetical protein